MLERWLANLLPETTESGIFVTFQIIAPYYFSACWERSRRCGWRKIYVCTKYLTIPKIILVTFIWTIGVFLTCYSLRNDHFLPSRFLLSQSVPSLWLPIPQSSTSLLLIFTPHISLFSTSPSWAPLLTSNSAVSSHALSYTIHLQRSCNL